VQRHRSASRLTSWLFVAALLLKSAVPMLASAAAGLQGRALADVCDVYGVDTSTLGAGAPATGAEPARAALAGSTHRIDGAHEGHGALEHAALDVHDAHQAHDAHESHHAHHAGAGAATASGHGAPAHGPASRVAHGADHCALSALAFALASDAPALAVRAGTVAPMPATGATGASLVDPAARWAAQLQHAPPASS